MGFIAEFTLHSSELPLVEVVQAVEGLSIEVENINAGQSKRGMMSFWAYGEGLDELEAALKEMERVDSLTLVNDDGGVRLYHVVGRQRFEMDFTEVSFLPTVGFNAVVTAEGWTVQALVADRSSLYRMRDAFESVGVEFELQRLTGTDEYSTGPSNLTTAQFDALVEAYEMGYFGVPREASAREVAESLGISTSSFSERLRRAESNLLDFHLGTTGYLAARRPPDS